MGVFHVFKIEQMVLSCKKHIYANFINLQKSALSFPMITFQAIPIS